MVTARIDDAGAKLAGARKDAAVGEDLLAVDDHLNVAGITLKSLWPIPEQTSEAPSPWRALAQQIGPDRAARVMVLYGNLAPRPHPDGHFDISGEVWSLSYRAGVRVMRMLLLEGAISDLDTLSNEFERLMTAFAQKFLRGKVPDKKLDIAAFYSTGKRNPRTLKHPFNLTAIEAMRFKTLARWGWGRNPLIPDRLAMGALKLRSRATRQEYWQSVEANASGWIYLDEQKFSREEDALANTVQFVVKKLKAPPKQRTTRPPMSWLREPLLPELAKPGQKDDTEQRAPDLEDAADARVDQVALRIGFDTPDSRDRTPQDLIEVFGFRGVEFGNYVSQSLRRWFVNAAFDACMDIANLLGMPPRFVSLDGRLGIAYGSRGVGFISSGVAHFDPSNLVLHFTRDQGPGSLAHEIFHGLDFWVFECLRTISAPQLQAAVRKCETKEDVGFASDLLGTSDFGLSNVPVVNAIRAWNAMVSQRPGWVKQSIAMDAHEGRTYWTSPREVFSRGFEVMVHDALLVRGKRNLMLVSGISEQHGHDHQVKNRPFPYPMGEDRKVVCQLMASVVRGLKHLQREQTEPSPHTTLEQKPPFGSS